MEIFDRQVLVDKHGHHQACKTLHEGIDSGNVLKHKIVY